MNFLNKVIITKNQELIKLKEAKPLERLKHEAESLVGKRDVRPLKATITKASPLALIAEIKLKSPSEGILTDLSCTDIARLYSHSQADVISVVTEEKYFNGHLSYLKTVRALLEQPVLRKDFIIDPYQIYESFVAGADSILLVTAILTSQQLRAFQTIAAGLGLACLVEVHNSRELRKALTTNADIIGINNRNLSSLKVSIKKTSSLIKQIPKDTVVISESGIENADQVRRLVSEGVRGILVGTTIIKSPSPAKKILELKLMNEGASV